MPRADAVEWKRLVPGVEARDSLVGLGLLAAWHIVFWIWGIPITQYFEVDGPGSIWPDEEQLGALMANAAIAGAITQPNTPFVSWVRVGCVCSGVQLLLHVRRRDIAAI